MENNFNWQLLRKLQIKKWRSTILKIHNLPRRICYQRNPPQKSERNPPKLTRYVIFDGSLLLKFWSDSSPFQKREILVYQFSWRLATSEKIRQVFHPFPILSCCLFGSPQINPFLARPARNFVLPRPFGGDFGAERAKKKLYQKSQWGAKIKLPRFCYKCWLKICFL